MLIDPNSHLYVYAITRDFGFAPNPFHGSCTLATCKPGIRKSAKVGDWILGVGGANLKSAKKMYPINESFRKISFNGYWEDTGSLSKSLLEMVVMYKFWAIISTIKMKTMNGYKKILIIAMLMVHLT